MKKSFFSFSLFIFLTALVPIRAGANKNAKQLFRNAHYACGIPRIYIITGMHINGSTSTVTVPGGTGSCVAVSYKQKIFILTNAHIVRTPDSATSLLWANDFLKRFGKVLNISFFVKTVDVKTEFAIRFKNNPDAFHEVTAKFIDSSVDLAILEPGDQARLKEITAIPLSEDLIESGEDVMAIGFPNRYEFYPTYGKVEGIYTSPYGQNIFRKDIISRNLIGPGNSGGPLVNEKGELIGIAANYYPNLIPHYSIFIHRDEIKAYLDRTSQ